MTEADHPVDPAVDDGTGDLLATINQRVSARLIDWIVVLIVAVVLGGFTASENEAGDLVPPVWAIVVTLAFVLVYEAVPVALRGQTLGKAMIGIELVMLRTGATPGLGPALLRAAPVVIVMALLANYALIALVLVYFSAAFMADNRGLLDRFAGTVVVAPR